MSVEIKKIDSIKKVKKPWGYEKWIADGAPDFKYALKEIFFKSGFKSSIQFHEFKEETTYIQKGTGILYYYPDPIDFEKYKINGYSDDDIKNILDNLQHEELSPGMVYHIKPGIIHRVEALTDLTLIESSTIELEDVIRINDEWGRDDGKITKEHKLIVRPSNFHLAQNERLKFSKEFACGKVLVCSYGINSQYYASKILLEHKAQEVYYFDSSLNNHVTIRELTEDSQIILKKEQEFSKIEEKTFDCILTFEEVQFIEDSDNVLRKYKKLLKDDGVLILSSRNKDSGIEVELLNKHRRGDIDSQTIGFSKKDLADMISPIFTDIEFFSQRDISDDEQKYQQEKSTSSFTSKLRSGLKKKSVDLYNKLDKNQNFYSLHIQKNIIEYRKKQFKKTSEKFSIDYTPKPFSKNSNPQNFVVVCKN